MTVSGEASFPSSAPETALDQRLINRFDYDGDYGYAFDLPGASNRRARNRKFADSLLEGAVTCELVSVSKFPLSRENTGNFVDSELSGASTKAKKAIDSVPYEPIPYTSEQGIF